MHGLFNIEFGFSELYFAYSASLWVFKNAEETIHFRPIDKHGLAEAH